MLGWESGETPGVLRVAWIDYLASLSFSVWSKRPLLKPQGSLPGPENGNGCAVGNRRKCRNAHRCVSYRAVEKIDSFAPGKRYSPGWYHDCKGDRFFRIAVVVACETCTKPHWFVIGCILIVSRPPRDPWGFNVTRINWVFFYSYDLGHIRFLKKPQGSFIYQVFLPRPLGFYYDHWILGWFLFW